MSKQVRFTEEQYQFLREILHAELVGLRATQYNVNDGYCIQIENGVRIAEMMDAKKNLNDSAKKWIKRFESN